MNAVSPHASRPTPQLSSGTQALLQGMILQAKADRRSGLRTAGFVSGYRGSPLGNVDFELWREAEALRDNAIVFRPGLNEDLAATACWGTQQVPLMKNPRYDGVFAFWYGKGPGVDRSLDALKHGNLAGTSSLGGVVALAGDDHGAKSSSTAHQSEQVFLAASMPVFNPSSIEEYRDLLPAAVALSRFASVWVGFKCVTEIVEASSLLSLDFDVPDYIRPDVDRPASGFHITSRFAPLAVEESLHRYRLPAALQFIAANRFDRVTLDSQRRTIGIVAPGKAHVDLNDALRLLGLDSARAARLGIRIFKPLITWPLASRAAREFCAGHDEVFVVEEKRSFVEAQLATLLLGMSSDARPVLTGKWSPEGQRLLPDHGELSAHAVGLALASRLVARGLADEGIIAAMARIEAELTANRLAAPVYRAPMFCSGCPHNRSTRLPEGSEAFGGIGCHGIAMLIPELHTAPSVQMGGEGATWIGIEPFGGPQHIFQNMGDGTYAHSGLLAIRAAIAAKVTMTYKILVNSAVAMTGGQPVEGTPDAGAIARQTVAEGAAKVVIVSEAPERFASLPSQIEVLHRDELMSVQRRLRDTPGVTVLVYDQGCAAERRRLRKQGEYPDLPIRTFINSEVCEGCGDCNAKSSCVSVVPIETELGTKRAIDQGSCNKDYTCVEGFCPSFMTVTGGKPRRSGADERLLQAVTTRLSKPAVVEMTDEPFNIVLAGIGGTGVISLGAAIASAAAREGRGVLTFDVTGVSQKNGAVFSHIRLLGSREPQNSRPRIPRGQLDLLVGCDIVAASAAEVTQLLEPGRSHAVINLDVVPTADFQRNPGLTVDTRRFQAVLSNILADDEIDYVAAGPALAAIVGSGPLLNILLLGVASQRGLLPLRPESIEGAIGKGAAGKGNLLAFRLGRLAAQDRAALDQVVGGGPGVVPLTELPFNAVVERAKQILTAYQSAGYAKTYEQFVLSVRHRDRRGAFGKAVALNLFKLMRYKDEYEVARLYADPAFRQRLEQEFEGDYTLSFHLAPPILAFRTNDLGEPRKYRLGGWAMGLFRVLRHFKFLRGTVFDPFARFADRKLERRLIRDYRDWIEELAARLDDVNYDIAVAIASLPEDIRGYGPIKERNVAKVMRRKGELTAQLAADSPTMQAA